MKLDIKMRVNNYVTALNWWNHEQNTENKE